MKYWISWIMFAVVVAGSMIFIVQKNDMLAPVSSAKDTKEKRLGVTRLVGDLSVVSGKNGVTLGLAFVGDPHDDYESVDFRKIYLMDVTKIGIDANSRTVVAEGTMPDQDPFGSDDPGAVLCVVKDQSVDYFHKDKAQEKMVEMDGKGVHMENIDDFLANFKKSR